MAIDRGYIDYALFARWSTAGVFFVTRLMDSTTISLCLTLFGWAEFRRAKGGVKAHVLLDHDDYRCRRGRA